MRKGCQITVTLDSELVASLKQIAEAENRSLRSLVEEALAIYVSRNSKLPRAEVMAHFESNLAQFGPLYERLAD